MTKKKGKTTSAKKRNDRSQTRPPVPDRRTMDQQMASLGALLASQDFASIDEANAFLENLLKGGGQLPPPPAETPLQKAQAVMYEAFDARGRQRIKLAKKALTISPDCADAYVLLAEEDARGMEEANAYYAQGVQAGRRALGPEIFQDEAGHFWGIVQTRPFMRALEGYAHTLWWLGEREASVAHQQEMLRLNPGDNQGIRYFLTHCLLDLERFADLERLFKAYPDDISAELLYPRALATYAKDGPSARASRRLKEAMEANPHVPAYLLGEKRTPRTLPQYYGLGDENEAILYAATYGVFWLRMAGAPEWLAGMRAEIVSVSPEPQVDTADDDWYDDEWDEEEEFEGYPAFELDRFLAEGEFPKSEHGSIRRCLALGVGRYFFDVYGYEKYGKQPDYLIDEYLHVPYLFGYGAVQVIRHKRLRPQSKLKVCEYTVTIMNLRAEGGIPYGLLAILAYLITQNTMDYGLLQYAVIGLSFGRQFDVVRIDWLDGVTQDEMLILTDWIAGNEVIPADEKLWWAWRLAVESEKQPHVGKAMANRWLSGGALDDSAKLALCHGWLEKQKLVGSPPLMWQINKALSINQYDEVERLIRENELEVPEEMKELMAEAAQAESEVEPGSLEELLIMTRDWLFPPSFLHRLALPALVRFGEDLDTVLDYYWNLDNDYDTPARTAGVADTIREFGDRLSAERRRELVERGLNHSLAQTRKAFYMLAEEYYGDEYLERALQDNAGSLRQWAAKKLAKRD